MTTESTISESDIWTELERLVPDLIADDVPAEHFTAAEFARRYNLSDQHARTRLKTLVETGKLCSGRTHVDGVRGMVSVYWLP